MKLIIAFLIIGYFAILETAAEPLCVCPRSPRQYPRVRQMHSLPRKYHKSQEAISGPDNVEAGSLTIVSQETKPVYQERAGQGSRGGSPRRRSSPSQPTRTFSEAESSQPEYVDLEDMRFLYGNYQG